MKQIILLLFISTLVLARGAEAQNNLQNNQDSLFEKDEDKAIQLKIYPNPCKTGKVTLETGNQLITEIRLINIAGTEVLHKKIEFGSNKHLLKLDNVPSGIYFMRIKTADNKLVAKKLVVSSQ